MFDYDLNRIKGKYEGNSQSIIWWTRGTEASKSSDSRVTDLSNNVERTGANITPALSTLRRRRGS